MMSLTAQLAGVLEPITREPLPASAAAAAKLRLLHAVGVGLASSALAAPACAWATLAGDTGPCVALGHRRLVSDTAAAFHNGVAAHSSLLEDCGPGGLREGSHPGTYVIPAALAVAESTHASGRRLLAGIAAGYEAVSRIGAAAPDEIVARGFRPVPVIGPFGAAAAAAGVQAFEPDRIASALGLAANMSAGTTQGFLDGTMEPYLHAGFAARNGLLAAQLSAAGATTSPSALEGSRGFFATFAGSEARAVEITRPLRELAVCRLGTKRFPSCVQNQVTMALILDHRNGGLAPDRIDRITLRRPRTGANGLNSPGVERRPPYHNMLQTQMAARFTTAAALLGRPVEQLSYFRDAHLDNEVVALAEKIELEEANDDSVTLEILRFDGDRLTLHEDSSGVLFPSAEEIESRFMERTEPLLADGTAAAVASLIGELEEIADVSELTSLLRTVKGEGDD